MMLVNLTLLLVALRTELAAHSGQDTVSAIPNITIDAWRTALRVPRFQAPERGAERGAQPHLTGFYGTSG